MPTEHARVAQQIREAIDEKPLEDVLRAAGAARITGSATEVLRETAAANLAARLAPPAPRGPQGPAAPNARLIRAAGAAIDLPALQKAAPAPIQPLLALLPPFEPAP